MRALSHTEKLEHPFLYILSRNDSAPPIKVGITSNLNARVKTIQANLPFLIDVYYAFHFPSIDLASIFERAFHDVMRMYYSHYREWLEISPDVAMAAMRQNFIAAHSSGKIFEKDVSLGLFLECVGAPTEWWLS